MPVDPLLSRWAPRGPAAGAVGAPTGSGKTICIEFAILRMFNSFQPQEKARAVYVAPRPAPPLRIRPSRHLPPPLLGARH